MVLLRSGGRQQKLKVQEPPDDESMSLALSTHASSVLSAEDSGSALDGLDSLDSFLLLHLDTCVKMLPGLISLAFLASVIATVRYDVSIKVAAAEHEASFVAKGCQVEWDLNQCNNSVPRLLADCNRWQACMLRPRAIPVTRLVAETAAECLNAFVEPLSYKAAAVLVVAVWTFVSALRSAFCAQHSLDDKPGQHACANAIVLKRPARDTRT